MDGYRFIKTQLFMYFKYIYFIPDRRKEQREAKKEGILVA